MGNLPNDRTVSLNPSDPWPSSLGNELQDANKLHARKSWWRNFWPQPVLSSGFTQVNLPPIVWQSSGAASFAFEIPFEDGDRFTGLKMEMLGDGAVDLALTIRWSNGMANHSFVAGTGISLFNITNAVASWIEYTARDPLDNNGTTPTPTLMATGDTLLVRLTASGGVVCFGMAQAQFDRLM